MFQMTLLPFQVNLKSWCYFSTGATDQSEPWRNLWLQSVLGKDQREKSVKPNQRVQKQSQSYTHAGPQWGVHGHRHG